MSNPDSHRGHAMTTTPLPPSPPRAGATAITRKAMLDKAHQILVDAEQSRRDAAQREAAMDTEPVPTAITPEWSAKMARREGNDEIGAGGSPWEVEQVNALADVLRDAYERHTDGHPLCDMGRPYFKAGSYRLAVEMAEAARAALLAELAGKAGEEVWDLVRRYGEACMTLQFLFGTISETTARQGREIASTAILAHVASLAQRAEQAERLHAELAHEVELMAARVFRPTAVAAEARAAALEECKHLLDVEIEKWANDTRDTRESICMVIDDVLRALVPGDAPAREGT